MTNYKMFEREITSGDHRSYHVCVEKFGNNFNPKSKFYPIPYKSFINIEYDLKLK